VRPSLCGRRRYGIETKPGKKDHARLKEFIDENSPRRAAARAATRTVERESYSTMSPSFNPQPPGRAASVLTAAACSRTLMVPLFELERAYEVA